MVRKFRKSISGLIKLKKIVYLISPNEINHNFYNSLDKVLSFGNVQFFQLRLKKIGKKGLLQIAKKIRKITQKQKVKFIINDDYNLVSNSIKENIYKSYILSDVCHSDHCPVGLE